MRHDEGRGRNVVDKGFTGYQSIESPAPRDKARNPTNDSREIIGAKEYIEEVHKRVENLNKGPEILPIYGKSTMF